MPDHESQRFTWFKITLFLSVMLLGISACQPTSDTTSTSTTTLQNFIDTQNADDEEATVAPEPPTATLAPEPPTTTPTPVPPAPTPTAKPPTETPTQTFPLATSAEEVIGTWRWSTVDYFIRFDNDGTFRQAHALGRLDERPYAINSYRFEGTKMIIRELAVLGVPSCGKTSGSYEIQLLESGNIQIVAIKDECVPRAGDVGGEYEPVR